MVILINLIVQAYERGTPKTQNLYKKLCIYSYMFKLQSPSKYSSFDAIQLSRHFFHCSKQFLNSLILMSFHASAIFFVYLFHLFYIGKMFFFEDFFIGETEKSRSGQHRVNREGGAQGSCSF